MNPSYPPFSITPAIVTLISQIHESLGEMRNLTLLKPSVQLRKKNKIRTVHNSLAIEGNLLSEEQITALLEKKKVLGPKKQIIEVKNALAVYDQLSSFRGSQEKDFLRAHKILMKGLISSAGKYRQGQVGIFKGSEVSHMAPPAKAVPKLMGDLFSFLKKREISWLIKACVFHYELEFIHPFEDGNGRMGRLWQQIVLMQQSEVFEYLTPESLIKKKQKEYYSILSECDRQGSSTPFIEFSLQIILDSLLGFKREHGVERPQASDRMQFALSTFKRKEFTRKDYMELFPEISTATASRDLATAVKKKLIEKQGEKSRSFYRAVY